MRQNPHTDGYVYGDHVPDHIFLLMEKQNDIGGESFFVDGEAVLKRLRSDPDAAALLPLLPTLVFDQTESAANGGIFQWRASKGPLFSRRQNGRIQWKRMLGADQHQDLSKFLDGAAPMPRSCRGITPDTLAVAAELKSMITPEELVHKIDRAIQEESDAAGRVELTAWISLLGEARYNEILVEAGPTLSGSLLRAGWVDRLVVYQAPTLMGNTARGMTGITLDQLADAISLSFTEVTRLGPDLRIMATPNRRRAV